MKENIRERKFGHLRYVVKCGWLLYLTAVAFEDLKTRRISFWLLLAGMIPGFWNLCNSNIASHLWAVLIGISMLILSGITGGALGEGDGWFFLLCALYWDAREVGILLLGSLVIGGGWGMALFMYGRWSGSRKMANATIPLLTCVWPVGVWLALR